MNRVASVLRRLRPPLTIAGRDVRATFGTPFGYGLAAGYLVLAGATLVLALRSGEARLDNWFGPLLAVTGVLAPLLTMRSFAEEERSGSLELLMTAPVSPWQVVAGKLLGALGVYALVVVGTVAAPLMVASMGDPDPGPIVTGYVGVVLVGVAFLAVGLLASSVTPSQLVASATAAGALLLLWFGAGVASGLRGRTRTALEYLSPSTHVTGFLRGTLSLTDVVYFASLALLAVAATIAVLRERR